MDQRTKVTKHIITQSFFALVKENPVRKITVTKICEVSGVNRTTFYKYYLDVWDLLDQIEAGLAEEMDAFIESAVKDDPRKSIAHILKAIRANGDKYLLLASDNGDRNYIENILKKWYTNNSEILERMLPKLDHVKRVWLYDFITQGDTKVVIDWIEGGMAESEDAVADFIYKLNRSLLDYASSAKL